jgi:hypothetical protein
MTEIKITSIGELIGLYEANTITTIQCIQILEKAFKKPLIVFCDIDGTPSGGKDLILKNMKLLNQQIKNNEETLIFLNIDNPFDP